MNRRDAEGAGKAQRGSSYRTVIIVLVLLLAALGIIGLLWATNLFGWRAWRIQEVQGFIGTSLLEGATDIHFATQNMVARIVWLRFTLPPGTDLTPFLHAAGITDPFRAGFTPFPTPNPQEADYSWWTPSAATAFDGLYWNTGDRIIEVLVDHSDVGVQRVYVRVYSIAGG